MLVNFSLISTDKIGYGLSQYNVEVCTYEEIWNEMMSRMRLKEFQK